MPNTDNVFYKLQDCLTSEVPNLPITPGTLIFCRDSGQAFYDTLEGERQRIAKAVQMLTMDADRREMEFPESDIMYIVLETNKQWIYKNGEWICLNGMNSSVDALTNLYNLTLEPGINTIAGDSISESSRITFIPDTSVADITDITIGTPTTGAVLVNNKTPYKLMGYIEVNNGATIYYIRDVELTPGVNPFVNGNISRNSKVTFVPDASIADLSDVDIGDPTDGSVTITNNTQYTLFGTVEITN